VKSVLLQKLDLHQDPSEASKIKKQDKSLIALAFSLAEFPLNKGALTQNFCYAKFCKYGQGNPDTPTAPKGGRLLIER
jgi:hypothetical protein